MAGMTQNDAASDNVECTHIRPRRLFNLTTRRGQPTFQLLKPPEHAPILPRQLPAEPASYSPGEPKGYDAKNQPVVHRLKLRSDGCRPESSDIRRWGYGFMLPIRDYHCSHVEAVRSRSKSHGPNTNRCSCRTHSSRNRYTGSETVAF
jgi:hypothetical protein